jgi:hypothetical protein
MFDCVVPLDIPAVGQHNCAKLLWSCDSFTQIFVILWHENNIWLFHRSRQLQDFGIRKWLVIKAPQAPMKEINIFFDKGNFIELRLS